MSRDHGTRARFVTDKCRCEPCRESNREYERWRRRQIAYGRTAYVDAEPIRAHLRQLSQAGIGWQRAARLAGLNTSTVYRIIYGAPDRGRGPSKRCRRRTATAILAVQASLDVLGGGALVPAVGTRRRLQALVAVGHSQARLARRLGMLPTNLMRTIHSPDHVLARTARAVNTLYAELWDQAPEQGDRWARGAAQRARNHATANGWVPPLAWDDDTIDDPAAVPFVGDQSVHVVDLAEVDHLAAGGAHITEIARRLDVSVGAIERAQQRARRAAA